MKIKQRNFGLDVIRMLAIYLVLFQHAGISIISGLTGLKIGGFGVEIFFVLSGYLIGGILLKRLTKENNLKSVWNFWVKRWFRILPVYYLMLGVKFFLSDQEIGANILYYIFFLQNNFYGIDFYEVTWSLVIEEWFYILAPLFIGIVFWIFKSKQVRLYSFIGFLILILLLRSSYVYFVDVPYGGINGNVPFRLDSLFYGVLLMYIKLNFNTLYQKLSHLLVFLISLIILTCYLFLIASFSKDGGSIDDYFFTRTIGFSIVSFFATLLIPFCEMNVKNHKKGLFGKSVYYFVTYTSLLTYAVYLIHPLVFGYLLHDYLVFDTFAFNFILSLMVTYGISSIVYFGYEDQWLKLRDKKFAKN